MSTFRSRKHLTLLSILTLFLFLHFSSSHPTNSTGGYTSAPGDSTCLQCHNQSSAIQGNIEVSGVPASPIPGETYPMTVVINNTMGSASRAGFQMVALRTSTNTNTGSFAVPASEPKAQVKTVSGKQYIGHANSARTFTSNVVEYEVEWTAPTDQDGEEIRFYAAALIGNGSGTSGDRYVVTNETATIQGGTTEPLVVTFTNVDGILCNGENNGTATAVATGGEPDYTYLWSSGETTATAIALPAGSNSVTVTDDDGISVVGTVEIADAPSITIAISFLNNVNCAGGTDGEITVAASGGTGGIALEWSNGAQGNSIVNLTTGAYQVTATDDNGCTATQTITVTEPTPVSITEETNQSPACSGGTDGLLAVSVSGGTSPYTYTWSTTQGTAIEGSLEGIPAGTYTVTVTDANSCTEELTLTIDEPAELTVTILDVVDELCPGSATGSATAAAEGGTSPLTFSWSQGSNTSTASDLTVGEYSVTVTDANGCTAEESVTISAGVGISVSLTILTTPSCNTANGSILATPTGATDPVTYAWSNAEEADQIDNLPAGFYSVTITDANGCTAETSTTLSDDGGVVVSIIDSQDISCAGDTDGSITTDVTNGTDPIVYNWSDGSTDAQRTELTAGTYSVTVTDGNNCQSVAEIELTEPPALTLEFTGSAPSATAIVSGGTPDYTYLWSTGSTEASVSDLLLDTPYDVTVTDTNGCTVSGSITFAVQDCQLSINVTGTNLLCAGDDSGAATVNIENATEPLMIDWSTGGTTATIDGLAAGTYTVTILDAQGCTETQSVTISEPEPVAVVINVAGTLPDVVLSAAAMEGSSPYSFVWSTTETTSAIAVGAAGTYSVTATDANGCQGTSAVTVDDIPCIDEVVTTSSPSLICFGDSTGMITVALASGSDMVSYSWSTGTAGSAISNLPAGTYSVTATAADGCIYTSGDIVLEENPELSILLDEISPASDAASTDGSIGITAAGGTEPYTFQWFDESDTVISTDEDLINASTGLYYLCLTDAANCSVLSEAYEIMISTATSDLQNVTVQVYPVPAIDYVQVQADAIINEVYLYNSSSQLIKSYTAEASKSLHIQTDQLPVGNYILQIETADGSVTKNIAIIR